MLPVELDKMGAGVDVVEAYRTVKPDTEKEGITRMLEENEIHMVTFTSSSTVSNYVEMFEPEVDRLLKWMENVTVACIGPITAQTAEEKKFKVGLVAEDYTIEGLTAAIVGFFANTPTA